MPATYLDSGLHLPGRRARAIESVLAMAMAFSAILFLVLAACVFRADAATPVDRTLAELVAPWRSPVLLTLFTAITALGHGTVLVVVAVLGSFALALRRQRRLIVILWGTLAGSAFTTWMAKMLVARARPGWAETLTAGSPSFPSSHTAGAMTCYAFLGFAFACGIRSRWARGVLLAVAATLIALVGFSRVFLGMHHATDVIGGATLAGTWVLGAMLLARRDPA